MEHTKWKAVCMGSEGWNIYPDCEELSQDWEARRRQLQMIAQVRLHGTWEEIADGAALIARAPEMARRIEELEALINELREAPLGPDVLRILAPWFLKLEALLP